MSVFRFESGNGDGQISLRQLRAIERSGLIVNTIVPTAPFDMGVAHADITEVEDPVLALDYVRTSAVRDSLRAHASDLPHVLTQTKPEQPIGGLL